MGLNINIDIQFDKEDDDPGHSQRLSFAEIAAIKQHVNAPADATFNAVETGYGWEILIHWQTDVEYE